MQEAAAERDVTRLILVEERVVEDEARLLDHGGAVDERDFPERGRLVVDRERGWVRMMSAPEEASTSTILPLSKRTSRSSTRVPAARSGAVGLPVPSALRQSGS